MLVLFILGIIAGSGGLAMAALNFPGSDGDIDYFWAGFFLLIVGGGTAIWTVNQI